MCAYGSTAVCGGGELRMWRPWRLYVWGVLRSLEWLPADRLSDDAFTGIDDTVGAALCG